MSNTHFDSSNKTNTDFVKSTNLQTLQSSIQEQFTNVRSQLSDDEIKKFNDFKTNKKIRDNITMKALKFLKKSMNLNNCGFCGSENPQSKCSGCKSIHYCNRSCQKSDWSTHKKICKSLKD
jgi:hypothetical protein